MPDAVFGNGNGSEARAVMIKNVVDRHACPLRDKGANMSKKVLIIDDDPDFVEAMSMLLEAKGYAVVAAHTGAEGFAKAKEENPGLILLDVMMAGKTEGFELSRELKKDASTKDTPVVLVSGIRKEMNLPFRFEPDEEMLPVKAFLEKPVKPEVLLKTVEENIK